MLNTVGKVLERFLLERLNQYLDLATGDRLDNQYGFVAGRSAEDAIMNVIGKARRAALVFARSRNICALVTLDVRNAFNTAP